MKVVAEYEGDWTTETLTELKSLCSFPAEVRPWHRDKAAWFKSLPAALIDCRALVAHSSSSAITAMMRGYPAAVTSTDSIAWPLLGDNLQYIKTLRCPDLKERKHLAEIIADHQWTLKEMAAGLAWKMLNGSLARAA